jgi:hypothetical protein
MVTRLIAWLRGDSQPATSPTPEQQEVLDVMERVQHKLETRRQDRQRMLDLQADVITRQEPDADR